MLARVSTRFLGDEGTVSLLNGVIEQVVTQAGDNDGDDALTSGAGDDILLGGAVRIRWMPARVSTRSLVTRAR
jgi:hypothetical protein